MYQGVSPGGGGTVISLAVGETAILLASPLHPYRMLKRRLKVGVQQNDSLADGYISRCISADTKPTGGARPSPVAAAAS